MIANLRFQLHLNFTDSGNLYFQLNVVFQIVINR